MKPVKHYWLFVVSIITLYPLYGQDSLSTSSKSQPKTSDSNYVRRLDTLLHLQTWVSTGNFEYKLVYDEEFKLVLAPNETNNLSVGFSYRYLELGISFSPRFMNSGQKEEKKGTSERFSLGTSFSMYRFNLSLNYSTVKGLYLKNSRDFTPTSLPDSPYILYPDLSVRNFNMMLRYNTNRNFSTAALTGGTQIQERSAITLLPTFQFARFRFHDGSAEQEVKNEFTYSTDLNILLPVAGTLVFSPQWSASMAVGPSLGVDFFKSVAVDDSLKLVLSKGTKFITGYTFQAAVGWHPGRFFGGVEMRYRNYGHKIEDISRLIKIYSSFQVFIGWRIKPPRFAKKSLDWVNMISPIDLD